MAAIAGISGAVTVAAGEVNGIKNWSLDYNFDALDSTDFQSDGVAEFIPGKSQWSGSFDGDKDGAPLTIGTEIALVLKESDTANQQWNGQAIVTGISSSVASDGIVTYSYSFQGTAALTIASA